MLVHDDPFFYPSSLPIDVVRIALEVKVNNRRLIHRFDLSGAMLMDSGTEAALEMWWQQVKRGLVEKIDAQRGIEHIHSEIDQT